MIKAILFDLDGTLVDLNPRCVAPIKEAIIEIMGNAHHSKIDNALHQLLGILGRKGILLIPRTLWKIGRGFEMSRIQALKFLNIAKKKYEDSRFNFHFIENAHNTLTFAIDHFKVGIVTSAFSDEINIAIENLPILNNVDVIIGFDDVKQPKPNGEPVLKALNRLSVNPSESLFIGDLPNDILAGKSAGVKTVGYLGEFEEFTENYLTKLDPDYIVKDQSELLELLYSYRTQMKIRDKVSKRKAF